MSPLLYPLENGASLPHTVPQGVTEDMCENLSGNQRELSHVGDYSDLEDSRRNGIFLSASFSEV